MKPSKDGLGLGMYFNTHDDLQKKIIQSNRPPRPEIDKRIKDSKRISQIVINVFYFRLKIQ